MWTEPVPNAALHRAEQPSHSLRTLTTHIRNRAVHTLGDVELSTAERAVLALGFKFTLRCPHTPTDFFKEVCSEHRRIDRLCRLRLHFAHRDNEYDNDDQLTRSMRIKLRVPNPEYKGPSWEELGATDARNNYFPDRMKDIETTLRMFTLPGNEDTRTIAATVNKHYNLNPLQQRGLRSLLQRTNEIVIRPSDKNCGICVMSMDWYTTEARRQLLNVDAFAQVARPHDELVRESYEAARAMVDTCQVMPQADIIHKFLTHHYGTRSAEEYKLPYWYALPKMHKAVATGRPIVAQQRAATSPLSTVLAILLNDLVARCLPWVVMDTKDVLQRLARTQLSEDDQLFTFDVVAHYPSMTLATSLEAVEFFAQQAGYNADQVTWLINASRVVLEQTFFMEPYTQLTVRQLQGTTMGTNFSPPLANLYIGLLEVRDGMLGQDVHPSDFPMYLRFLDDGVGAATHDTDRQALMQASNPVHNDRLPHTYRLTWEWSSTKVIYLDLELFKGNNFAVSRTLSTRLYQKPMSRFTYVPYFSNHQRVQLHGFIKSELHRYMRNCSSPHDYLQAKRKFYVRLAARAYPTQLLRRLFLQVPYSTEVRHRLIFGPRPEPSRETTLAFRIQNSEFARRMRVGGLWQHEMRHVRRRLEEIVARPVNTVVAWCQQQRLGQRLGPLYRGPRGAAAPAEAPE